MSMTVTVFGRVPPETAALLELAVELIASTTGTKFSKNAAIIAALEMWSEGVLSNNADLAAAHLTLRSARLGFPSEDVAAKLREMGLDAIASAAGAPAASVPDPDPDPDPDPGKAPAGGRRSRASASGRGRTTAPD